MLNLNPYVLVRQKIMRNFLLVPITLSAFFGCTTGHKTDVKSQWLDLDAVAESVCNPWPVAEKQLEVESLLPVQSTSSFAGVAAHLKLRNASFAYSFIPSDADLKLDQNRAVSLPLTQSSVLLSGWVNDNVPMVVIATHTGNRSALELRSLNDNHLIAKSSFILDGVIRDAEAAIDGSTMWLSLRTGDYSTVYAKVTLKGAKAQFDRVATETNSRGAVIAVDTERHLPFIVENQPHSDRFAVKLTPLRGKDFSPSSPQLVELPVKGGVESWSVTSGSGGLFVGAVTGDSMVGQGSLILGFIKTGVTSSAWAWQKEVSMPDIHVSEPVWAPHDQYPVLTLMKWVDEEATLGLYRANKTGFLAEKDRGVYAKGSVAVSAFKPTSDSLGTVIRQRKDDLWSYQICRVKF